MTNILAVDTATQILTIVLNNNSNIHEIGIDEGFSHSENIIPAIDSLLKKSDMKISELDLLICTRGPGSFTGLRISMATFKGINTALDIPIVSIPTLDVYANNIVFDGIVIPVIDAKKKCFYCAIYRNGLKETMDLDIGVDELLLLVINEKRILLTGPDSNILYDKLKKDSRFILDMDKNNYGKSLLEIGINLYKKNGPDKIDQGPLYIRKSEAEINLYTKK